MNEDRRPRTIYAAKRAGRVIYVGQTLNFRKRVHEHKFQSAWVDDDVFFVALAEVFGADDATAVEREMIETHRPTYNNHGNAGNPNNVLPVADGISVAEAAARLGWSIAKVRRVARSGEIEIVGRLKGGRGTTWALNPVDVDYQARVLGGAA